MIPAEAVEAAAKAIYSDGWDGAPYWESMADDNSDKIHHRATARAALEAAAPYMLASVSTLDALLLLEPGTVLQGPDFHEETYKCTAPGTFHTIASTTEYRASELVGRGPFTIIHGATK